MIPVRLDITDDQQIAEMGRRVAEEVGPAGLDGLVNNAGITIPCPLEVLPLEDFRRLLAVNVTGQLAVTQAVLPALRASSGRIVFVSSISGRRAVPMLAAYCASKAGLNTVADGFRQELRRWGIRVSIVEPGSIETPIWGRGTSELDDALDHSSVDAESLYGGLIAAFRKFHSRMLDKRIAPEKVAEAIEHALMSRRPRLRYLVGLDAKGQAVGIRLTPERLLDFGVARYLRA
jgi:NAD(P)-dependent dehydrogenase (short-subunit alcohol dehydrogenase family)